MYGMVNEAIRTFIENGHGPETWREICRKADVAQTEFERMSSYDDAITYRLVGAVSEHTGLDAAEVLNVFGTYWVEYAGKSSFGNLMKIAGDSFVERVRGLDEMHERILMSLPHLKPPSFELEEKGDDTYLLHYYSDREGLTPMVIGLLHGLAAETGERIDVALVEPRSNSSDHDVFEITLLA